MDAPQRPPSIAAIHKNAWLARYGARLQTPPYDAFFPPAAGASTPTAMLTTRIDGDLKAELERSARAEDRSVLWVANSAIRAALDGPHAHSPHLRSAAS